MTPWWAWLLVILGPAACAAAGGWVALLWGRHRRDDELDRAWDEGYERARYDLAVRYDELVEQGVELHHRELAQPRHALLVPAESAMAADLATLAVRDEFASIRQRLGLLVPADLDYAETVAQEGLLVDPVGMLS